MARICPAAFTIVCLKRIASQFEFDLVLSTPFNIDHPIFFHSTSSYCGKSEAEADLGRREKQALAKEKHSLTEEKNGRLKVTGDFLFGVQVENEDEHHSVVWCPADDESCDNDDGDHQRFLFRLF